MIELLPYKTLEPYISNKTLNVHYNGHHMTYYNNLTKLLPGVDDLDFILKNYKDNTKIYNNAAQIWNHNFFWKSMSLDGKNDEVKDYFESKIDFSKNFNSQALDLFGSGWCWLTYRDDGTYDIINTANAQIPSKEHYPLLVLDLWEHAYYLDYENKKLNFIDTFKNHLINWNFVKERMILLSLI